MEMERKKREGEREWRGSGAGATSFIDFFLVFLIIH